MDEAPTPNQDVNSEDGYGVVSLRKQGLARIIARTVRQRIIAGTMVWLTLMAGGAIVSSRMLS